MLESKRFPREFVFKGPSLDIKTAKFRRGESQEKRRERCRECKRLYNELFGMEASLKNHTKNLDTLFWKLKRLAKKVKQLSKDQAFREKVDILLNVIGALLSGGTTTVVRKVAGEMIGLVGTAIGLPSNANRIRNLLNQINRKTFDYERVQVNRKFILDGISKFYVPYRNLECLPTVARRF